MTEYGALLREIAVPRLTGSEGNVRVRAALKRELGARGFVVMEHSFPASPASLRRVARSGALLAALTAALAAARIVGLPGHTLLVLALAVPATALVGFRVLRAPAPVTGKNLVAVQPRPGRVAVWLVAHYDSKGQPISMLTRVVAAGLAVAGLPCLAMFATTIPHPDPALASVAWLLPGLAGGLLLAQNRVTNGSPGACDNASGVIAVLATVDRLPADARAGVVFSDAEEFGLEGARALARERAHLLAGAVVINFDGIDDAGRTRALIHRSGPTGAVVANGLGIRPAFWLPVVVDGLALRRAAAECVTILRGNVATTRIVHTPLDTPDRMALQGVRDVAERVAGALARQFAAQAGRAVPVDGQGRGPGLT